MYIYRCVIPGLLKIHVAHELVATLVLGRRLGVDADVDHGGAGLDPVRLEKTTKVRRRPCLSYIYT